MEGQPESVGTGRHPKLELVESHLESDMDEVELGEKSKLLKSLLGEEEELKKTLEGLGRTTLATLVEVNKLIVGKQDEIDRLQNRVRGLEEGKAQSSSVRSSLIMASPNKEKYDNLNGRTAEVNLPEEIWELVLLNLRDHEDQRNASNAFPLFGKILHPWKGEFLFPLVSTQLLRFLDHEQILNSRQVCQTWNSSVDKFLEDHPSLRPFDERRCIPGNPDLLARPRGRALEFAEMVRAHPRNPFVGREASLQIMRAGPEPFPLLEPQPQPFENVRVRNDVRVPPHQQQFFNDLSTFLQCAGPHIWYLHFELKSLLPTFASGDVTLFHFLTRDIFLHFPNLRRLRIVGAIDAPWFKVDLETLPDAPQLETLQVDLVEHFHGPGLVVATLIRKYHKQLKSFHVRMETLWWCSCYLWNGSDLGWDNLVELHVDGVRGGHIKPIIHLRMPQLRKLVLTPGVGVDYDFETIMDILINLSATTKLSVLGLLKGFDVEQIASAPATLFAPPSLTTREVEHSLYSDYNFLVRFPFLQNLIVYWPEESFYRRGGYEMTYKRGPTKLISCPLKERTGIMLPFQPFMLENHIMYDCDIWELLPRLKVLTFQRDVLTREDYQRFMEQQNK